MMRIISVTFSILFFFSTCSSKKSESTAQKEKEIPTLLVRITDASYEAPDSVAAGYVSIKLQNNSSGMHSAHLIRQQNGYTTEQLITAYSDSMRTGGPRPSWMTHRGGVISEPGMSDITLFLEPGNYTWVCVMGTDTEPHFAGHEHKSFKVFDNIDQSINLPAPDVTINMTDLTFELDKKITSGKQSIDVVNTGTKYHLTAISKLNKDATANDVINWFTNYNGPPPAQGVIATSAIGPGLSARITIDFEPGEYVLFCMANAEGKFHLLDGAITSFTVE